MSESWRGSRGTPGGAPSHQTLSVLVENRSGVLARVSGLFARRGFNIISLAVAPSDDERFSRITIVIDVEETSVEQITKQLFKLVNVVKITELHPADAVEARAAAGHRWPPARASAARSSSWSACSRARSSTWRPASLTVMLAGHPDQLDGFEDLLRPYGITELQRTGRVALPKLDRQTGPRLRLSGKAG